MSSQGVNNTVYLRFRDLSSWTDGDADQGPTIEGYEETSLTDPDCGWDSPLAMACVASMPHLNDGTPYQLIELPPGFSIYVKYRNRAPRRRGSGRVSFNLSKLCVFWLCFWLY